MLEDLWDDLSKRVDDKRFTPMRDILRNPSLLRINPKDRFIIEDKSKALSLEHTNP